MFGLPVGLNSAFALGTQAVGKRFDPYSEFNFLIEINGLLTGGFTDVNGLQGEIEMLDYQEGGQNEYVHKLPGPAKYSQNLTFKHGLTSIDTLWNWFQATSRGVVRRKSGSILMLDSQRWPVMWWNFNEAIPVSWEGPQFNAGGDAISFESIQLAHRGISKPFLSHITAYARAGISMAGVSNDDVQSGAQSAAETVAEETEPMVEEAEDVVENTLG